MSIGESIHTARGTEIKDIVAQFGAAILLLALAIRCIRCDPIAIWKGAVDRNAAWSQLFLLGWVGLSFASAAWSAEPDVSFGQAAVYTLGLMFAVGLGGLLRQRDVHFVLIGYIAISTVAAGLCIWYFHERNPYHRPGFPVGNPNTMAASIVPAAIVCLSILGRSVWDVLRRRERLHPISVIAAGVALLLLGWCLWLTNSRGALLGLGIGCVAMILLLAGRRTRLVVALCGIGLFIAAGSWVYLHSGDTAMGRGATVRARFYYWRYAVLLWEQRPLVGHGAGAYARLANQFSLRDRALDPAAFADADWIAHAHNELFEIFVDIGLVGGVTFVAGMLGTFFAVLGLIRRRPPPAIRWEIAAIGGGIAALVGDSLVSPGLRLAVVPTILYMLLGLIWAICRERAEFDARERGALQPGTTPRSISVAIVVALCGVGCCVIARANVAGVNAEYLAMSLPEMVESASGRQIENREAIHQNEIARARLIEPVRRLFADERALRFIFDDVMQRFLALTSSNRDTSTSDRPDPRVLSQNCETLYQSALRLDSRAPTIGRTLAIAARAAEMLCVLNGPTSEAAATEWRNRAEVAWRNHRLRFITDEEALLSLAINYPGSLTVRISYLRDALRNGFPSDAWFAALQRLESAPKFDEDITRFTHAVGPIDPRTDADSILLSFAPEAYRLSAIHAARRGDPAAADAALERSIELYAAVKSRFPRLVSAALAEQADFDLLMTPASAQRAVEHLERAITELPAIQQQQRALLAEPFRRRLAAALVVAERVDEARRVLRETGGEEAGSALADECLESSERLLRLCPTDCPAIDHLLRAATDVNPTDPNLWYARLTTLARAHRADDMIAALRDAEKTLPASVLSALRTRLCSDFADLRERICGNE